MNSITDSKAKNPKAVRSTCSRKFEFSFLNGNLMVRAGILLIFDTGGAASTMIARCVMLKDESRPALASPATLETTPIEQPIGSGSIGRLLPPRDIGFVGLGRMGAAMAANLAAAGVHVTAYVRRPDQMQKLEALSLKPTTDITKLFECEIVISMLPDDDAAREIVFGRNDTDLVGLAKGLMPGAIHLSMSTISTATASQLASEHARYGQGYVAAPVFGNPTAAKARQLFIIAAGPPADVERCRPLFADIGQQTFVIGTNPADANLFKLLGNMMTATALETLGEVAAVIRKRGLEPKPFMDLMTGTFYGGRVHRIYGDKIAGQSYEAGFIMPLALKDVRLALTEAENAGVPMPSVGVVRDRMITGIARGYAELDWTALGLVAAEEAGISPIPAVTVK
jgi:3-hydroxyisobutyrate dehydrogenase-like beta-hydroxyacid dehydrogenase